MFSFRKKPKQPEPSYLIALIGVTGAGKSTFISKATGRKDIVISNSSASCTQDILPVNFKYKGKQVTLIDTPGFDDTNRSDADILQVIANFLSATEQTGMLLAGIIFLQPVTTPRYQGSERIRTRLIEKILGKDALPNVILATTRWSKLTDKKEGEALVKERSSQDEFWGYMISHGARVVKHDDTKSSALKIVSMILDNKTKPVPLQMQVELGANNCQVALTSAGKIADEALEASSAMFKKDMHAAMTQPGEKDQEEINEIQEKLNKTEKEKEKLKNATVTATEVVKWVRILTEVGTVGLEVVACSIM